MSRPVGSFRHDPSRPAHRPSRHAPFASSSSNPVPPLLARAALLIVPHAPSRPPSPAMIHPAPLTPRPVTSRSTIAMPRPSPPVACPARPSRLLSRPAQRARDAPRPVLSRPPRPATPPSATKRDATVFAAPAHGGTNGTANSAATRHEGRREELGARLLVLDCSFVLCRKWEKTYWLLRRTFIVANIAIYRLK